MSEHDSFKNVDVSELDSPMGVAMSERVSSLGGVAVGEFDNAKGVSVHEHAFQERYCE